MNGEVNAKMDRLAMVTQIAAEIGTHWPCTAGRKFMAEFLNSPDCLNRNKAAPIHLNYCIFTVTPFKQV
ncbi:MAG: hypothetical protein CMQ15_10755 [Gammaproteobacteria bacterium]|nr:hypothetical protein [Gammaproteobacteria bacterium]